MTELVDGHVRVAAAACYDRSDRENGYNFVRLNPADGTGQVWLRRYDSKGGDWVPDVTANKTDNDGLWPLRHLHWLLPQALREEATASQSALEAEPRQEFDNVMARALEGYHRKVQQDWDARWSRVVRGGDDE